jgi:hypothetical protein
MNHAAEKAGNPAPCVGRAASNSLHPETLKEKELLARFLREGRDQGYIRAYITALRKVGRNG